MKTIRIFTACAVLMASIALACMLDDPLSVLGNKRTVSSTGDNGAVTTVTVEDVRTGVVLPDMSPFLVFLREAMRAYITSRTVAVSFPLTLQVSFSGFTDLAGNPIDEPVTRLSLYIWDRKGEWVLLRDIRNPQYAVADAGGAERALFGMHTIPHSMGYEPGEVIPVVIYFASENHETFPLATFLENRRRRDAAALAGTDPFFLVWTGNTTPR